MQPEGTADEGFSPLRIARAGRRAGRHVALAESDGSGVSSGADASINTAANQELARQYVRTTSQQGSAQQPPMQLETSNAAPTQQQQPLQQAEPQNQQHQDQQQQQQQQQPQLQPAMPPVKRVGFSLDGVVVSAGRDQPGSQQQHSSGISRRKQEQLQRAEQAQAKQRNKYDEKLVDAVGDEAGLVPSGSLLGVTHPLYKAAAVALLELEDVPELEEAGKEDITRVIAQAPKATSHQVQAIPELDHTWLPPPPSQSSDINLSLLTSCLLPSAQVAESPDVWDYSLLFSQLKAELQNEPGSDAGGSSSGAAVAGDAILV